MSTIKPTQALLDVAIEGSLGYLACAYTAKWNRELERVRAEEITCVFNELLQLGIMMYSPLTAFHYVHNVTGTAVCQGNWQQLDELMLSKCDYLLVYETGAVMRSAGVADEIRFALKHNIPIYWMDAETRNVEKCPHHRETELWFSLVNTTLLVN